MGNEDNVLRFVIVGRSDDGTVTIGVAPARAESRVSISIGHTQRTSATNWASPTSSTSR